MKHLILLLTLCLAMPALAIDFNSYKTLSEEDRYKMLEKKRHAIQLEKEAHMEVMRAMSKEERQDFYAEKMAEKTQRSSLCDNELKLLMPAKDATKLHAMKEEMQAKKTELHETIKEMPVGEKVNRMKAMRDHVKDAKERKRELVDQYWKTATPEQRATFCEHASQRCGKDFDKSCVHRYNLCISK